MIATGLEGLVIIVAKDIADTESVPRYVRIGPNRTFLLTATVELMHGLS
jgi:hypothetical protein